MAVSDAEPIVGWSGRAKALASLAVLVQILAVTGEPMRFFSYGVSRGSSPAADPVRVALAPYIEFAYLNHGYFFFAPEPGPSHLMLCSLRHADGSVSQIRYPDKTAQRPRLLYHRHFMLAEFLNQLHEPPVDPVLASQLPGREAATWSENRQRFEMVRNSMQSHLAARFGAESATIDRLRHILPGSDAVLKERMPLNDPRLYIVLPDSVAEPSVETAGRSEHPPLGIVPETEERKPLPTQETVLP